jgi:hypothetical protein
VGAGPITAASNNSSVVFIAGKLHTKPNERTALALQRRISNHGHLHFHTLVSRGGHGTETRTVPFR